MALAGGTVFAPWVDLCFKGTASNGYVGGLDISKGKGGLAAINASTGAIEWKHSYPTLDVGAATVANDVVFTETYSGTIYAYNAKTGAVLWTKKAPNGINSFPAITKTMLIVGAGAPASKHPVNEIVAYSLNGQ